MLTHTITLSFSLSTTFNSLWKRQVQTLIEPEPDLAPALSVRPAVLSNPLRSMSSQPGSQQAGRQPGKQPVNQAAPSGQRGPTAFPRPQIQPRFTGLIGQTSAGHRTVPSPITAPLMQDVLEAGRGGKGTPKKKACWTSTRFTLTAPAKTTSSCILLNASTSIEPSLPPSSSPFLSSLHPSWSYFDSGLSLFHPPSSQPQPFSSQPQFPIDLLIAVCLWESGRSLPLSLCSPLHGFVFPFPSFLLPPSLSLFLSLHPLHLPIDAAALKHELEKAGESNLPREIGFTFSYARFLLSLPRSLSLTPVFRPPFSGVSSVFLLLSANHVCCFFTPMSQNVARSA